MSKSKKSQKEVAVPTDNVGFESTDQNTAKTPVVVNKFQITHTGKSLKVTIELEVDDKSFLNENEELEKGYSCVLNKNLQPGAGANLIFDFDGKVNVHIDAFNIEAKKHTGGN